MYADSYEQQSSSASQSYPRLRTELVQSINDGNLVTAYVGHGGEVGWASENILQLNDTKMFSNGAKLPFLSPGHLRVQPIGRPLTNVCRVSFCS